MLKTRYVSDQETSGQANGQATKRGLIGQGTNRASINSRCKFGRRELALCTRARRVRGEGLEGPSPPPRWNTRKNSAPTRLVHARSDLSSLPPRAPLKRRCSCHHRCRCRGSSRRCQGCQRTRRVFCHSDPSSGNTARRHRLSTACDVSSRKSSPRSALPPPFPRSLVHCLQASCCRCSAAWGWLAS